MKNRIGILSFFLTMLIVGISIFQPAYGITDASLLPNAVQQFFDNNGNPLTSGTVTTYEAGTSTLKTTWKDSAGAVVNTNPIKLDAGGKAIIYGEGTYRQLVKDRNGNIIWDAVTAPGGGGSTPTSVGDGNLVGTVLPWSGLIAPNQYVFGYGQEISRATFPDFFTAVTQALTVSCNSGSNTLTGIVDTTQVRIGSPLELPLCVIAGTTVTAKTGTTVVMSNPATVTINSTATFFPYGNGDGASTFNVPDLRGYAVAGRDNMGGTAAGRLSSLYFNTPGLGATGGSQFNNVQLPQVLVATGLLSANSQATVAVPTVQPTITINYVVKITKDTSTSIATGVASLNGMTGTITCGSGLLCTGNIISVTSVTSPNLVSVATGWGLTGGPCTVSCTVSVATTNPPYSYGSTINLQIDTSAASNALTVSLKSNDGTNPTVTNPLLIPFRSSTASSGAVTWISAATVISANIISGATLGTSNAVPFRYWLAAVNDSNVVRLCTINTLTSTVSAYNILPLNVNGFITSSGATANSAQTWYCGTAVTNKPYTLLGYITYESGLTTAGLYTAIPNVVQLYGPGVALPGQSISTVFDSTSAVGSTSSATFVSLSGGQRINYTQQSGANIIRIFGQGSFAQSNTSSSFIQIGKNANILNTGTPAIGSINVGGGNVLPVSIMAYDGPQVISLNTYLIFGKTSGGVTLTYPATATAGSGSSLELQEIQR